jgi:hypothetical protein
MVNLSFHPRVKIYLGIAKCCGRMALCCNSIPRGDSLEQERIMLAELGENIEKWLEEHEYKRDNALASIEMIQLAEEHCEKYVRKIEERKVEKPLQYLGKILASATESEFDRYARPLETMFWEWRDIAKEKAYFREQQELWRELHKFYK